MRDHPRLPLSDLRVKDAVWTSSDTICTVYRSGAFVRHDVAHSYAPLHDPDAYIPSSGADNTNASSFQSLIGMMPQALQGGSLNRHALAWDPRGGVAFVSETTQPGELPFDDVCVPRVIWQRWPSNVLLPDPPPWHNSSAFLQKPPPNLLLNQPKSLLMPRAHLAVVLALPGLHLPTIVSCAIWRGAINCVLMTETAPSNFVNTMPKCVALVILKCRGRIKRS